VEIAFLQVKAVLLLVYGEDGLIASIVELILGVTGEAGVADPNCRHGDILATALKFLGPHILGESS
jgi:hypothetical protein